MGLFITTDSRRYYHGDGAHLRCEGEQTDETGMVYLRARYYNPSMGVSCLSGVAPYSDNNISRGDFMAEFIATIISGMAQAGSGP